MEVKEKVITTTHKRIETAYKAGVLNNWLARISKNILRANFDKLSITAKILTKEQNDKLADKILRKLVKRKSR